MTPTESSRRHDIDALRVLAFGLLILYHCGMLYVADWHWHLKSSYLSEWLQYPMLLSNRWRMALLFLISGLAVNFLRQRSSPGLLVRSRTHRLLLPLLFGVLVVVPLQAYFQAVANHSIEPGFGRFLIRYFTGQNWPKDAFDGSDSWIAHLTWNHLWYLPYLWTYTVVLIILLPLLESPLGRRLRRHATGLRGAWLLLLPALPKTLYLATLADRFPESHDLIRDWYAHAFYFTFFLYGYLLGTDAGLWTELKRLRWTTLGLAALCFAGYAPVVLWLGDDVAEDWHLLALRWLSGLNSWLWIATILGWSHQLLNRPFRWLPYATEAVFPWYMLHQTLIVAVAFYLVPLRLGPVIEPLLVIGATIAGCLLLHEFVIRRSRWLRPLFGLKPVTAPNGHPVFAGSASTVAVEQPP